VWFILATIRANEIYAIKPLIPEVVRQSFLDKVGMTIDDWAHPNTGFSYSEHQRYTIALDFLGGTSKITRQIDSPIFINGVVL